MISRRSGAQLKSLLEENPAVALLGPRQVGKTTLALELAQDVDSVYLDLESPSDRARLSDAELYLSDHEDRLVILDEVHRVPDLFQSLRGLIDRGRRRGRRSGRFLLLGSASMDLLRQSGETLAGRIAYLELSPFDVLEVGAEDHDALWVRGGFPDSFLARDDTRSLSWRENFIRTYLERDVPQLGPRIPAETLRRFWVMLAHTQGGLLNAASLARGIGVSGKTIHRYLDLMVDLLLVRRLPSWQKNVGKRLVKSPKTYIRDSGIAHALLGLGSKEELLGHPVVGPSWGGVCDREPAGRRAGARRGELLPRVWRRRGRPGVDASRAGSLGRRDKAQSRPTTEQGFPQRMRRHRAGSEVRRLPRRGALPDRRGHRSVEAGRPGKGCSSIGQPLTSRVNGFGVVGRENVAASLFEAARA